MDRKSKALHETETDISEQILPSRWSKSAKGSWPYAQNFCKP